MKLKIITTLTFTVLLMTATGVRAQERTDMNKDELTQMDSLLTAHRNAELKTQKAREDKVRLADIKHEKDQTKAKAKEARRIEKEANAAARESRYALRAEKKAQKARKDADSQSKKAAKARDKSDEN